MSYKELFPKRLAGDFNFEKVPALVFFGPLLFLTILRNGLNIHGSLFFEFQNFTPGSVLPSESYRSKGSLWLAFTLEKLGGLFGGYTYFIVYTLLLILLLFIIHFELNLLDKTCVRVFWIMISLSPAVTIVLSRFGTLDAFCLIPSILGAITKSRIRALIYASLFLGVNPEGAFIAGLCFLLLQFSTSDVRLVSHFRDARLYFSLFLTAGSIILVIFSFVDSHGGSVVKSIFLDDSRNAFAQDLASGLLLPISWFGSLWIILISMILRFSKPQRQFVVLIIAGTGLLTMIASDGTRNSALAFTFLIFALLADDRFILLLKHLDTRWLILLFFIPPINVANFNLFLPFHDALYFFGVAIPFTLTA